jgi:hypothetical protein
MVAELVTKFQQMRGSQITLQQQLETAENNTIALQARSVGAERLAAMVQEASARTQKKIEYHIGHVVTLALQAIFTEAYEFKLKFEKRRKGTECELWLLKDGKQCDPLVQSGGGVCDIISFSLRVALLSIAADRNRIRKALILDEPFRNLHGKEKQKRTSEIINLLSKEYKLQIIMVSDVREINYTADKVFNLQLEDGASSVD